MPYVVNKIKCCEGMGHVPVGIWPYDRKPRTFNDINEAYNKAWFAFNLYYVGCGCEAVVQDYTEKDK